MPVTITNNNYVAGISQEVNTVTVGMASSFDASAAALLAAGEASAFADSASTSADAAALYAPAYYNDLTDLLSSSTSWPVGTRLNIRTGEVYDVVSSGEDLTTAAGVKLYAQPLPAEYTDRQFNPASDGVTDDTEVYQRIAAHIPNGKTLRIVGAGRRVISDKVTFSQENLNIICDTGVEFFQKSGTQTLDQLFEFSGDYLQIFGGKWSGNVAGNTSYTGRGELIRVSGDSATLSGVQIDGVQDVPYATGIYLTGDFVKLRDITTFNTGLNAIRSWAKHIDVDGLSMFGIYGASAHGFAQDGDSSHILKRAILRNIYAESLTATATEAVLFDNDGNQGGSVLIDGLIVNFPNMSGPDAIKFAYLDDVTLKGLRGSHAGSALYKTTLRIQQDVARLYLDDCIFPGNINFDITNDCNVTVSGSCIFGNEIVVAGGIEDFKGSLSVSDGAVFKNVQTSAITTSIDATDFKANLGRLHLHGAVGYTPNVVKSTAHSVSGTGRRLGAGQITIREPLSVTGTMKSRPINGRWIGLSETQDASCAQAGDRVFLCSASDFPPRDSEGWQLGDVLRNRSATPGATPAEYRCTTAGAACKTAWVGSTAYSIGSWVYNGLVVYKCVTSGTSAPTGGPTGVGTGIVDGTVVWDRVDSLAIFKGISSISA